MVTLNEKITSSKGDNLNLIRLLLALTVLFGHCYLMSYGDENLEPFHRWTHNLTSGRMAVYAFFFISGFLITGSWQRSKSFLDYFLKRVLRIYPGFIVVLSLCAILIWLICPEFKSFILQNHLRGHWLAQVAQNALFLQSDSISDLNAFAHNPRPGLTNGALWTIPVEFGCYLAVLVVGLVRLLRHRVIALVLAALAYEYFIIAQHHFDNPYEPLYLCFIFGAIAWLWKDKIPFSGRIAGIGLLTLIGTSHFQPYFSICFPLAGGYCLLWLAYGPKLPLSNWASTTDLSYGTYLYSSPLQQVLATVPNLRHPSLIFVLAVPLTLAAAWLSWTVVEKPCLSLKRRICKAKSASLR
jgi:peptidoglycan/LPS O-acetylase OafA/YrhL